MNQRKRRSGLSGAELVLAVQAIKNLITKWEEGAKEAADEERTDAVTLQAVQLDMLTTKLIGPQTSMSYEHLDKLKIFYSGDLHSKTNS
ncbi:hypothetical protein APHAL10511_006632 [Amanita phalloides]|nr:hypothetical protein APHAL10511_006632 [Amanita phalloides]